MILLYCDGCWCAIKNLYLILSFYCDGSVYVSAFDCNAPRLTMQDSLYSTDPMKTVKYPQSKLLQISVDTVLDCAVTLQNKKQWTVERLDDWMNVISQVDLSTMKTSFSVYVWSFLCNYWTHNAENHFNRLYDQLIGKSNLSLGPTNVVRIV
jgi:hypothetical protein